MHPSVSRSKAPLAETIIEETEGGTDLIASGLEASGDGSKESILRRVSNTQ
jgi:hypothetical protein